MLFTTLGLIISYAFNLTSGATILVSGTAYLISLGIKILQNQGTCMTEKESIKPHPQATSLAYECLKETSRQIDFEIEAELNDLSSTVHNAHYQQLEQLLENQQFRDADYETYRLMIETVGKEEGQYFDPEDFNTFPCEDLRTIDRLWVKYSNGEFGFSVQKNIYVDILGGTRYYDEKIWNEFCDCIDAVGEMEGDNYVNYLDITFSVENDIIPEGNLPVVGRFGWEFVVRGGFSSLVQRLVTCNI